MNWISENWLFLLVGMILAAGGSIVVVRFAQLPSDQQLLKVRQWLLWAVTYAESQLGGGTGRIKLAMVYDMFVGAFSWLAKVLSFELFAELVDDALEEMRQLLESNQKVREFVEDRDGA